MRRIFLFSISICILLISCVKESHFGASSEKKILGFTLQGQSGNTLIDQSTREIKLTIGSSLDISMLTPASILLSTFATINPGISATLDFSSPVIYTVTAEDGSTADYTIFVTQEGTMPQLENSSFDDWYTTPKGYQEPGKDANSIWSTGNAGTTTLGDPNVNPMTISGTDLAAVLITRDMGNLAGLVKQRMAAGSMFTGDFELDISNPLNSAKFGIGFTAKPKGLTVQYAYSPGTPYLNNTGQELAQQDSCDIYAFLENRSGDEIKRVATAWFRSGDAAIDSFTLLSLNFTYGPLGSNVPAYQKPANGLYANPDEPVTHITIVFSSSYNGSLLEGGTNSTLVINNLQLVYE